MQLRSCANMQDQLGRGKDGHIYVCMEVRVGVNLHAYLHVYRHPVKRIGGYLYSNTRIYIYIYIYIDIDR